MNDEFPIRSYLLIPKSLPTQRTSCSQSGECRTTQTFSFHNRKSSDSNHAQIYHVHRRTTRQRSHRNVHISQQSPNARESVLRAEPQLFQVGAGGVSSSRSPRKTKNGKTNRIRDARRAYEYKDEKECTRRKSVDTRITKMKNK